MAKCDDESPACRQDRKDYDDANFDKGTAEGRINAANGEIDTYTKLATAAGVGIGAGVSGAAISSWTGIGLIVGAGVAYLSGAGLGYCLGKIDSAKQMKNQARADCETARKRMKDAYDKSLVDCRDSDCRPPATIPACP